MSAAVTKRAEARQDLVDLFTNIGEYDPDAANRFLTAVDQTTERLAESPGLGSPWESSSPELAGLRFRLVKGFKKYLIFYLPKKGGIEVVRVLHGARNIEKLLED
jgi:toxin ParE1/3/4